MTELSREESGLLEIYEGIIDKGMESFLDVGNSLLSIRNERLYRKQFRTFDEYVGTRWGLTKRYANRIIQASEVVETIRQLVSTETDKGTNWPQTIVEAQEKASSKTLGEKLVQEWRADTRSAIPVPSSESVARPLAALPKEQVAEIWIDAVAKAPNGKPTAKQVKEAIFDKKATSKEDIAAETRRKANLPENVNVVVIEMEDEAETPDVPEESLTDREWLDRIPLSKVVPSNRRGAFELDALGYRAAEKELRQMRATLRPMIAKALKACDPLPPFFFALRRFTMLNHPRDWRVCPTPDQGGCGGTGEGFGGGRCDKCYGGGYRV